MFKRAGMDLNELDNVMYVVGSSHKGRHTRNYHDAVFADVSKAMQRAERGLTDPDALLNARRTAARKELDRWRERIEKDPGVMYR